jgi:polysaccharide export outer membrane protein
MRYRTLLFLVLASVTLAMAGDDKGVQPPKPAPQTAAVAADSYVIGAQDVLQITVWKEPEMSGPVTVRPDGKISLALLNDVDAAGLTPVQLSAVLKDNLTKFIADPRVTVIVTQSNSRRVYVIGQVAHPGAIALTADMNVLQAITTAGGLTQFSDGKKTYILRTHNGTQQKIAVNYKQLVKGDRPDMNVPLVTGDTVVVP